MHNPVLPARSRHLVCDASGTCTQVATANEAYRDDIRMMAFGCLNHFEAAMTQPRTMQPKQMVKFDVPIVGARQRDVHVAELHPESCTATRQHTKVLTGFHVQAGKVYRRSVHRTAHHFRQLGGDGANNRSNS